VPNSETVCGLSGAGTPARESGLERTRLQPRRKPTSPKGAADQVFISISGIGPEGFPRIGESYRLLGVVSAYYYEDSELSLQIAMTVKGTQHANSGISMIVPADSKQTTYSILPPCKCMFQREIRAEIGVLRPENRQKRFSWSRKSQTQIPPCSLRSRVGMTT
jgi:hypothetical protein